MGLHKLLEHICGVISFDEVFTVKNLRVLNMSK